MLASWTCPSCFSDATHVERRQQLQPGSTRYTLRCGECEARRDIAMSPPMAARLDQFIADELAAMEVEAERFAVTLEARWGDQPGAPRLRKLA